MPRPTGATELRCYRNTARWGSACTFCLCYHVLCYRKSAMQGHYICFHFINCHYSTIFILSEGLEGHGEWVTTADCEHSRCGSLPGLMAAALAVTLPHSLCVGLGGVALLRPGGTKPPTAFSLFLHRK